MKFAFIPQSCIPFHARTLEERPLGGIETAVIRLSEALDKLGHRVTVFTGLDNPPLSAPLYLPFRAIQDLGSVDVLVAVREWQPVLLPIEAKVRCFWTGDSYDQLQTVGIGDRRVARAIDWLLPVSCWHGNRLCEESGFPEARTHVLPNGLHREFFVGDLHSRGLKKSRKRAIYSSTPYRGLRFIPAIYRELQRNHPDLELHVFSGYGVYAGTTPPPEYLLREYEAIKKELEQLPGCYVHGNVKQSQLAEEYLRSSLMLYPNTFEETSCISAMEAQAAGCAIVTSQLGALPETVGDAGILITGQPTEESYLKEFVHAADKILTDDELFHKLSEAGKRRSKNFWWEKIASDFVEFITLHLNSGRVSMGRE